MDLENLKAELAKRLPVRRYDHVLRVAETAKKIAASHGLSVEQAELAALFHDIAKAMDKLELKAHLKRVNFDERVYAFPHEVWHAPVGSIIAKEEFGIVDEDILNAICYHTTGRAGMSSLEKLIYVADLIEPGRDFPGIDSIRESAQTDLDLAMADSIIHTVQYLVGKRSLISPDSIDCYNENINTQIGRE